jgi:hypothetical protein
MEGDMQFLETIFHVAPDGGSGAFEALLVTAIIAIGSLAAALRRRARPAVGRLIL